MHKHAGYEEQDPSTLDSHSHSDSDSDPFDELPDENGMFENSHVICFGECQVSLILNILAQFYLCLQRTASNSDK